VDPGCVCVLISFIYNLGLTNKPIKGPPQGVCACPHSNLPLLGLAPNVCVCGFNLSLSMTVVSPELHLHCSSWYHKLCCHAGKFPATRPPKSSTKQRSMITCRSSNSLSLHPPRIACSRQTTLWTRSEPAPDSL
jgi:hypothetical protein